MGKMSEKRKAELQAKYGDDAFTPIQTKWFDKAKELSAHYILFVNKDNKHGYCEKCNKDVEFDKTKHNTEVICPNCETKLTVMHTWRRRYCERNVNWFVYGEAVDEDTFALRYIKVDQRLNYTKSVLECAREIFDFKHGWTYQFSKVWNTWEVNNREYFREHNPMNWNLRKECCIIAKDLNNIYAELPKLKTLKYFEQVNKYKYSYRYTRDALKGLYRVDLYEKLEKVGLSNMAWEDYCNLYNWQGTIMPDIKYNKKEKSVVKMLGLNKLQFNVLLKHGTIENWKFMLKNPDLPIKRLEYILENNAIRKYENAVSLSYRYADKGMKATDALKYFVNNNINSYEYSHYLNLLEKLDYKIDKHYLFPKDFRAADDRLSNEWQAKLDAEALKKMGKQSKLIKKISDGLKKMDGLQEFLGGSNGLLVYVPESAKDLLDEGRNQHNCIGSYVDRIAENKTLVFFVRKLNAPNEPFVSFEYFNGEVVQCRYDHNVAVKNDNEDGAKILSFVDAFAERLRQNKVLMAA